MSFIQNIDWDILYWIQNTIKCGFLDFIMPLITKLGSAGAVWLICGVTMLFFPKYRKCGIMLCGGLALSLLVGNLVLKPLIARPRPCWLEDSVKMLVSTPSDYSFPSGHTLASFISATIIFYNSKKLGIGAIILAVLISFSRLYLFVHFPSDVLGGIAIGVILGIVSILIVNAIYKSEIFTYTKKGE